MEYRNFIEITPGKRGSKPCLAGMRITVADVLGWLANGVDAAEITADYPEVSEDHIKACLAFAADRENHQLSVA